MKYLKQILFSVIVVFSSTVAQQKVVLNQNTIDTKAVEIEKRVVRDRCIMYGLMTLSVAHEIYQWIPLLKDLYFHKSSATTTEENLSFFQAFKAGVHHLFYTKQGWISLMQSTASVGGFIIISEMGKKFIHPDTLRWYINAYAPYDVTIQMMQDRLTQLQNPSLSPEQQQINNEMVSLLYDRSVRQAELMCAFMKHKAQHLPAEEKIVAQRAQALMLQAQNSWLYSLNTQLAATERDYNTINTFLEAYKNAIQAQVNYFALIEGEIQQRKNKRQQKISD